MITKLAIWWLRKRKLTVLIGHDITGGEIKAKSNKVYLYDSNLKDVAFKDPNGIPFNVPEGKFAYKRAKEASANG
ncbi:hypothetical protein [Bacillus pumilus]|uniref:hypothetical protein n=1 Tax=Bacillus pumilus TaxID=1408 RepID=UPI0015D551E0|nr:hypothetical protein [Bacillus pumilus]QLI77123.1 hypothetical protein HZ310_04570 [Bacillus pumilus]